MLRLQPMNEDAFEHWAAGSRRLYADEKVKAGNWPAADADALAEEAFEELLPQGRETPGHEVRAMINHEGEQVGHAWFTVEDRPVGRVVYIYDIAVDLAHRRRGYARLALAEIEEYAREHGCAGVMLHVFGYNTPARELYRSEGFEETNVVMLKRVDL